VSALARAGLLGCAVSLAAVAGASAATAAPATCKTADLVVWLNTQGNATAGSTYFALEFTNLSARTCTMRGYPGVSAVDLNGRTLGSAGSRLPAAVRTVTLATGATAEAVLRIVEADNFPPSTCRRVEAAGVRVFPPNQTAARIVPFPFRACSRSGPVILQVKAVATR
jgi:Protein of unknown function (DUF4232)